MKSIYPYALLGALLAAGALNAATTTPVGYSTQTLPANTISLVGITLQTPVVASGTIDAVAGTTLTDNDIADFAAVLPAGRTYILELGGTNPVTQEFTVRAGKTITLPSAAGAVGDSYKIRVAPTIEETFGTTAASSLTRALGAANADVVWVPTGPGTYQQYFIHTSGEVRRINGATAVAAPNVPILYMDGVLVQKKSAASSVTITGEVKLSGSTTVLGQGFNLVSLVAPVGLTLANAGFEDDIATALGVANADVIWVPVAGGNFAKYYRRPGATGAWYNADTNTAVTGDVNLPSAVYVQRKNATPVALDLNIPANYPAS